LVASLVIITGTGAAQESIAVAKQSPAVPGDLPDRRELAPGEPGSLVLTQAEQEWLAGHRKIKLGIDGRWPPIDFVDADERHKGITADYLALLEQRLGVRFELVQSTSFNAMLQRLEGCELAVGLPIVKLAERAAKLDFTAPVFTAHKVIVTRLNTTEFRTTADLVGKTVAIEKGFSTLRQLQNIEPEIKFSLKESTLAALKAVSFGQADAYVGSLAAAGWLINTEHLTNLTFSGDPQLGVAPQRFAVIKDPKWTPFIAIVNKTLASIPEQRRRAIERRWLPFSDPDTVVPYVSLSVAERLWLDAHPHIRLGAPKPSAPFAFFDAQGRLQGISADMIAILKRLLGVDMDLVPGVSGLRAQQALARGEIDVIPAIAPTRSLAPDMRFSVPYSSQPYVVFVRSDARFVSGLADLHGRQVAVQGGTASSITDVLQQAGLEMQFYPRVADALLALSGAKVDAYIGDLSTSGWAIDALGLTGIKVAAPTKLSFDQAMAVRKDWPQLLAILNKALNGISIQRKQQITQRWMPVRFDHERKGWALIRDLTPAFLVTLLIVGGVLLVNRRLRREIFMRRETEAELRAHDVQIAGILDAIPMAITVSSHNDRILFSNAHAREELGDGLSMLGSSVSSFLSKSRERNRIRSELNKKGRLDALPVQYSTDGGEQFDGLITVLPIKYESREAWLSVMVNLSERLHRERQRAKEKDAVEIAGRFKSAFLTDLSHGLRTPVNAVVACTHLLGQTALEVEQRRLVDSLELASKNLGRAMDSILDFSALQAGEMEMEQVAFQLDDVLVQVSDGLAMHAEMKGIDFIFDIAPEVPGELLGDPLRLARVLFNLADNGIKFTVSGWVKIIIEIVANSSTKARLRFCVADSGPGISAGRIGSLFDSFGEVRGNNLKRHPGMGLGLAVAQKTVQEMGGSLRVDSDGKTGTTFHFELDFGKPSSGGETLANQEEWGVLNALVVDNHVDAAAHLCGMLASMGVHTVAVACVDDAQRYFSDSLPEQPVKFDFVVLDEHLISESGETQTVIEIQRELKNVPVVILSAWARDRFPQSQGSAESWQIVQKPVTRMRLGNQLDALFGHRLRQTELRQGKLQGRVLVIDDDGLSGQVAQLLLENLGLEVQVAASGAVALDLIQDQDIDLALIDLQMPGMNGFEWLRRVRYIERYQDLPVIAVSAHGLPGDREKSLAAGLNEHLVKPLQPGRLFSTLCRWLPARANFAPVTGKIPRCWRAIPGSLPGISPEGATAAEYLNTDALRSLLRYFYTDYHEFDQQIDDELGARHIDQAIRKLARIDAICGNFGAERLQRSSAELVRVLDRNGTPSEHEMREFKNAFVELMAGLATWLHGGKVPRTGADGKADSKTAG